MSPLLLCLSGRSSLLLPLEQESLILLHSNDLGLSCHSSQDSVLVLDPGQDLCKVRGNQSCCHQGMVRDGELGVWGEVVGGAEDLSEEEQDGSLVVAVVVLQPEGMRRLVLMALRSSFTAGSTGRKS